MEKSFFELSARKIVLGATALLMAGAVLVPTTSAEAVSVKQFSNCEKLTKVYPYGVAKSKKAAKKQKYTPAYDKKARKIYKQVKKRMDRDKDGTACEKS